MERKCCVCGTEDYWDQCYRCDKYVCHDHGQEFRCNVYCPDHIKNGILEAYGIPTKKNSDVIEIISPVTSILSTAIDMMLKSTHLEDSVYETLERIQNMLDSSESVTITRYENEANR